MTFPRSEADLPHPQMTIPSAQELGKAAVMRTGEAKPTFTVRYTEGLKVGYKWYDAEHKPVLFPFGYGLSYTTYQYSDLKVDSFAPSVISFKLTNAGSRPGDEIAEIYAALPPSAGEPPKRLVGWSKVHLEAGESKNVSVTIPAKYLSIYNEAQTKWELVPGSYTFMIGGSSQELPLHQTVSLQVIQ